jgi:hypothetical protein
MEIEGDGEQMLVPPSADVPDRGDGVSLPDINFDDGAQT